MRTIPLSKYGNNVVLSYTCMTRHGQQMQNMRIRKLHLINMAVYEKCVSGSKDVLTRWVIFSGSQLERQP